MRKAFFLHGRLGLSGGASAALAALLLAAARPFLTGAIYNPDLFWHLSGARYEFMHGSLPRADFLSHTLAGRPWTDFEWGAGVLYFVGLKTLGLWGLAAARAATLLGAFYCTSRLVALYGYGPLGRAAAALLCAGAVWPYADVRPDNFSLLFFSGLLWRLERARLDGTDAPPPAACAAAFALWANLHMGFVYGLALLACYAVAAASGRRWSSLRRLACSTAAAAGGACLNPYGPALAAVLWDHWRVLPLISSTIAEWHAPEPLNAYRWPYFGVAAAACAGLARRWEKPRSIPWGLALALFFFTAAALRHDRNITFGALVAVPAAFCLCADLASRPRRIASAAAAAGALACAAMLAVAERGPLALSGAASQLADFLESEQATLASLPLYNTWEDGGYLGWRLYPRFRVFFDGRYIFHDLLGEVKEAARAPATWARFLDRYDVALASMKRSPLNSFVEGGVRRPYYAAYMPEREWALVYWDETRVVLVRRSRAALWAASRELRLLRPDDSAFISSQLGGRADRGALARELELLGRAAPSALPEAQAMARAFPRLEK